MKRFLWNIIIDAMSLVVFVAMISSGLILKFILPPGSGRVEKLFWGGGRREKTIDIFWGLARHQWGEIHFYISLAFLILLLVHLFLHWNWIKSVTFGTPRSPQSLRRKVMTVVALLLIVVMLILPWLFPKQTYTRSEYLLLKNGAAAIGQSPGRTQK